MENNINNFIKIVILKYSRMGKCESCDRTREIYFNAEIMDNESPDLKVGSFQLCKQCGDNLNKILGNKNNLGEKVKKEFVFNK